MTNNNFTQLKKIRALLLDVDGTLLQGKKPVPDLALFFQFLKRQGVAFTIATNNSVVPASIYRQKMVDFGIEVSLDNILTASHAAAAYLKTQLPTGANVYVVGQDGLKQELETAGFNVLPDSRSNADAVVVGGDPGLTYDKLKHATLLLRRGAAFIGTNPDAVYPTEEGLAPECGAILAALQATSGLAPVIIGKPQPYLFQFGMQRMGSQPENTAMIGDRLETDIYGGKQVGVSTILVTTGVDNEESIPIKNIQPDLVVHSLAELVSYWEQAVNNQEL